jgi:hypothetical protein
MKDQPNIQIDANSRHKSYSIFAIKSVKEYLIQVCVKHIPGSNKKTFLLNIIDY